jgi:3-oxoacyl-[acyl-carrier-protein] synthase II
MSDQVADDTWQNAPRDTLRGVLQDTSRDTQRDTQRRVAITGLGAITPLGFTAQDSWEAIRRGDCGIAPITAYNTDGMAAKLAAEVRADLRGVVTPAEMRKMDRFTLLALIAAREAYADSGINASNTDLERVDVLVGSGIGGLGTTVHEYERGQKRGFDRVSPFFIPTTIANMAAGRVAIELGLKGDSSCTVTACSSSAHALGEASRHIRHGYADAVLAGGAEACVIPLAIGGFTSLQALHTGSVVERASIPFDAERSGFVLGEGAGMLILEEWEHARQRGAHIYAELTGFGATCDAHHITAPDPEGSGAIRAMTRALADAGLAPKDIGYINAHGTSTLANDTCEVKAVKAVFGADGAGGDSGTSGGNGISGANGSHRGSGANVGCEANGSRGIPPLSSTTSMTGHLLGAAGAVEALFCTQVVREGFIPATINYRVPDPTCNLDVVACEGRVQPVTHALSNSLGFGGHNASLIISRCDNE